MKALSILLLLLTAGPASGQTVLAARTIRAQTLITAEDVTLTDGKVDGALTSLDEIIGFEARVALYAGRPVRSGEVGPPALVERNQIVALHYRAGGLVISAEGRSLGRAGVSETIRVMNLASRQTVSGRVLSDGTVAVGATNSTMLTN